MKLAETILIRWNECRCGACTTQCDQIHWITACEDNKIHITRVQAAQLQAAKDKHQSLIDAIQEILDTFAPQNTSPKWLLTRQDPQERRAGLPGYTLPVDSDEKLVEQLADGYRLGLRHEVSYQLADPHALPMRVDENPYLRIEKAAQEEARQQALS